MLKSILSTIVMSICISATAQSDSIHLEFVRPYDNLSVRLAEFNGINVLTPRLTGCIKDKAYNIYAITMSTDSTSEQKVTLFPIVSSTDTLEIDIFAKALSTDTVKVGFAPWVPNIVFRQPTANCLLIEALAQHAFSPDDEIPLAAYSTGRHSKVNVGGIIYDSYQICEVRQSGVPMKNWCKEFDIPAYTYFVLRPNKN